MVKTSEEARVVLLGFVLEWFGFKGFGDLGATEPIWKIMELETLGLNVFIWKIVELGILGLNVFIFFLFFIYYISREKHVSSLKFQNTINVVASVFSGLKSSVRLSFSHHVTEQNIITIIKRLHMNMNFLHFIEIIINSQKN